MSTKFVPAGKTHNG